MIIPRVVGAVAQLLVSADLGFVWYFKPENFGKAAAAFEIHREEGDSSL